MPRDIIIKSFAEYKDGKDMERSQKISKYEQEHCESAEHGVMCSFIYVRLGMQVIVTSMEEFIGG